MFPLLRRCAENPASHCRCEESAAAGGREVMWVAVLVLLSFSSATSLCPAFSGATVRNYRRRWLIFHIVAADVLGIKTLIGFVFFFLQ